MLLKTRVILILAIYLGLICNVSATTLTKQTHACIMLGSTPSLIIKYKHISSSKNPSLDKTKIHTLSSNMAAFTSVKAMSGEAYIAYFSPGKMMQSGQIKPGCYSPAIIDALLQEVKSKADIEYADANSLMYISKMDMPNVKQRLSIPVIDPIQWDMLNPPGGIDTQSAYSISMGNPNTITAVLDSGILNNDSLNPNILSGVTFNNNGSYHTGAAPSCDASCEGYDHGTHVSGTVSASGVLAYGMQIYGVAPLAKILPVNVFTKLTDSLNCDGSPPCIVSFVSDQVNALNWLSGQGFSGLPAAQYVTMINMSLGGFGSCGASRQTAFNSLIAKDISIAVAAGNDNIDASFESPANCLGVMPVAAIDRSGYGTFYSNYGNIVSFAAPGGDTTLADANGVYSTVENAYAFFQGTSMASPHAAGIGALLYSIDPTLTPAGILNLMQTTAIPFPSGGPGLSCTPSLPCGSGIINAYLASAAAYALAPTLTWTPDVSSVVNTITQATISWQAAAWSPARTTPIRYTVNLDGQDVASCTQIAATSCVLHLSPNTSYTVIVRATDARQIYTPLMSSPYMFAMPAVVIKAPVVTIAARNPLKLTSVYVYYTDLGGPVPDNYMVNGLFGGAQVSVDAGKNRFILDNISTPKQIDNVTISAVYGSVIAQSNAFTIPSILGRVK